MRTVDSILADLGPFDDSRRSFLLEKRTYEKRWQATLTFFGENCDNTTINGQGESATEAVNVMYDKYSKLMKATEFVQTFCPPSIEYSPSKEGYRD